MEYGHFESPWNLEPHYGKHVSAMTLEGLHLKSEIAAELAWRDQQMDSLREQLSNMMAVVASVEKERDSFYLDYRMKCDVETKDMIVRLTATEALLATYRASLEFVRYIYAEETSGTSGADFDRGLSVSKATIRQAQKALALHSPQAALNNYVADELERFVGEAVTWGKLEARIKELRGVK